MPWYKARLWIFLQLSVTGVIGIESYHSQILCAHLLHMLCSYHTDRYTTLAGWLCTVVIQSLLRLPVVLVDITAALPAGTRIVCDTELNPTVVMILLCCTAIYCEVPVSIPMILLLL